MALVTISLAGPGASLPTLSSNGWVAELPIRPRTDTRARIAGKMARIP
jgi:hypothetical protein